MRLRFALALITLLAAGLVVATAGSPGPDVVSHHDTDVLQLEPHPEADGVYASFDDEDELAIHVAETDEGGDGLNPAAETDLGPVFTIANVLDRNTDDETVVVWVVHDDQHVTFYDSETGASIDNGRADVDSRDDVPDNAIALEPGDHVDVALQIDTRGTDEVALETFSVVAVFEAPDDAGDGTGEDDDTDGIDDTDGVDEPDDSDAEPTATPTDDRSDSESDVNVTDVTVDRTDLAVGESVSVTVYLENEGPVMGQKTVQLKVDGSVVDDETVTVLGGQSKTTSFTHSFEVAGTYTLSVDEFEHEIRVDADDDRASGDTSTSTPTPTLEGGEPMDGATDEGDLVGELAGLGTGALPFVLLFLLLLLLATFAYLRSRG